MFLVWSEEDTQIFNKKGTYDGDIRIAKKLRVENRNTIFIFKDASTRIVPTADVRRLMLISNQVLQSSQVSQVYAKKVALAESVAMSTGEDESDDDDSTDEEDDRNREEESDVGCEEGS